MQSGLRLPMRWLRCLPTRLAEASVGLFLLCVVGGCMAPVMVQSTWVATSTSLPMMKQSTGWRKIRMVGFGASVINLLNLEGDWVPLLFWAFR